MSTQPTPDKLVVAVAILADGTPIVGSEWKASLAYIQQILHPLRSNPGQGKFDLLMAFVAYGTEQTLPSPIVSKKFFTNPIATLATSQDFCAMAQAGNYTHGAGKGYAALDGVVTCMELFETLTPAYNNADKIIKHIIHITAGKVSQAIHPQHNQQYMFDDVTWETLPAELRKRQIAWNLVCLRSNQRLLGAQQASGAAQKPSFPVAEHHHLSLASLLPQSQEQAPPSPPRFDMPTVDVPDPQPPQAEPEPSAPTANTVRNVPQPPQQTNNAPLSLNLAGMTTIAEIEAGFRTVLGPMAMQLKVLSAQGRTQEAGQLKFEMNRIAQQFAEARNRILGTTAPPVASNAPVPPSAPVPSASTQMMAGREITAAQAEQWRKMQEQKHLAMRNMGPGNVAPPINMPTNPTQEWHGMIAFHSLYDTARPDAQAEATIHKAPMATAPTTYLQTSTWPSVINLRPSHFPVVSLEHLRAWITNQRAIVCFINSPRVNDGQNAQKLKDIAMLLESKHMYALASWSKPDPKSYDLLITPFLTHSATAIYFPEGTSSFPQA